MTAVQLVVTDLDGSLLDHDTYRYDAAREALQVLEQMRVPVVFASSKTREEILALRRESGNDHPFIVENGAAVFVPEGYFTRAPVGTVRRDGYDIFEQARPREHWIALLDHLRETMPGSFVNFAQAGTEGIARMTGLDAASAALANRREYSEPVKWQGDDSQLPVFLRHLETEGARVLRGGRFFSVAGNGDKGSAWAWLREQYRLAAGAGTVYDLAIGDGANDVPMLNLAQWALLIPAPGRDLPDVQRASNTLIGQGTGPEAWAWGVREWLRRLYQASEEL
jgi:mannosyl-3-phosphoglycerate phosphatase family protein